MELSIPLEASGVPVFFEEPYRNSASVVAEAIERTAQILLERWNLNVPASCQVHILTDWKKFLSDTAPFWVKPLVWLTKPIWRQRVERTFALAGGWMLPWPGRLAVGVKPAEMLPDSTESSLGDRLFVEEPDTLERVRQIACHEFTHACTAHLRLSPWLNEGLAMRAVDHLVGRPTVKESTRSLASDHPAEAESAAYRRVFESDHDAIIRLYASGYWATVRLDIEFPEQLRRLLANRIRREELNRQIQNLFNE